MTVHGSFHCTVGPTYNELDWTEQISLHQNH